MALQRSIDPDPDSTTSDISVLDEMDEYLDECLALQDARIEGPTPPKINRGGKSPSATSSSFKYTHGYEFVYINAFDRISMKTFVMNSVSRFSVVTNLYNLLQELPLADKSDLSDGVAQKRPALHRRRRQLRTVNAQRQFLQKTAVAGIYYVNM